MTCTGDNNEIKKLMKLLPSDVCATTTTSDKIISVDIDEKEPETDHTTEKIWVKCGKYFLSYTDKEALIKGERLSDVHINFGQHLLKQRFPHIYGLSCTQQKPITCMIIQQQNAPLFR